MSNPDYKYFIGEIVHNLDGTIDYTGNVELWMLIDTNIKIKNLYGNLTLENSFDVQDLSLISSLEYVSGYVHINDMYIKSLKGLENLRRVDGGLCLSYLYNIDSLDYINMEKIGEDLDIYRLDKLQDLSTLSESVNVFGSVIFNN